jgi:hypothetical protein
MDAQGTMRLMFDTMDTYDRADFTAWPRSTPRTDPAKIRQFLALVRARLVEVRDTTQSAAATLVGRLPAVRPVTGQM